jgi:hypothetical protein
MLIALLPLLTLLTRQPCFDSRQVYKELSLYYEVHPVSYPGHQGLIHRDQDGKSMKFKLYYYFHYYNLLLLGLLLVTIATVLKTREC